MRERGLRHGLDHGRVRREAPAEPSELHRDRRRP
jgi:hypothetical protein